MLGSVNLILTEPQHDENINSTLVGVGVEVKLTVRVKGQGTRD